MKLSKKFLITLKVDQEKPAYRIAQDAGISPQQLTHIITGVHKIKLNDERVIAVGKVLGLKPEECFE